MKIIDKYGFVFSSLYYDPLKANLFNCRVPEADRDATWTYHYVAVAGVKYDADMDDYSAIIHNSWGESSYNYIKIFDGYMDCNMANAMFVLEPKY